MFSHIEMGARNRRRRYGVLGFTVAFRNLGITFRSSNIQVIETGDRTVLLSELWNIPSTERGLLRKLRDQDSAPHSQLQQAPPVYYPMTPTQASVATGAYKAVIAVLLLIIVLLGVGLYATSSGHLFSLTGYRYSLANPPNAQSVQPPNTSTAQPPY